MQGYFAYKLEGTRQEIEESIEVIKELAQNDVEYQCLLEFAGGVEENHSKNNSFQAEFGTLDGSGNIRGVQIYEFESFMSKLCKQFPHLSIEGTGYLLDFPPYPIWKSEVGNDSFEIEFETISLTVSVAECFDEDSYILHVFCENCGEITEKDCSGIYQEGKWSETDDIEVECSYCGTVTLVDLEEYM